jgi:hypothetical protein
MMWVLDKSAARNCIINRAIFNTDVAKAWLYLWLFTYLLITSKQLKPSLEDAKVVIGFVTFNWAWPRVFSSANATTALERRCLEVLGG